jgi:hypothetical protein
VHSLHFIVYVSSPWILSVLTILYEQHSALNHVIPTFVIIL